MYSSVDHQQIKENSQGIYRILYGLSLYLILASFFFASPSEVFTGLWKIFSSPSKLITDYFALAGIGATLMNSGLITLMSVFLVHRHKTVMTGPMFAAILTVCGFSFFGKNLFNSIPITLGVFLYARLNQMDLKQVQLIALFSSGLSPLISELAFASGGSLWVSIPLSYLVGVVVGVILPPLSAICLQFHQGFNLYNVGFTIGLVGMTIAGLLRMRGMDVQSVRLIWTEQVLAIPLLLSAFFLALWLYGFWLSRKKKRWEILELWRHSGRLVADFVSIYGLGASLLNMGSMGLLALWSIYGFGGIINGPVIGGIMTVVAFSAFGKHPFNTGPIVLGIVFAAFLHHDDLRATATLLSILFGTTLAPISGHYGPLYGLLAGYVHMSMVVNVGYLHGGMNLYNNGFSGGFVAAILVTIFESVRRIDIRGKRHE